MDHGPVKLQVNKLKYRKITLYFYASFQCSCTVFSPESGAKLLSFHSKITLIKTLILMSQLHREHWMEAFKDEAIGSCWLFWKNFQALRFITRAHKSTKTWIPCRTSLLPTNCPDICAMENVSNSAFQAKFPQ